MGLAANAVRIHPPISHSLDDHFRTVIVPDEVDEATKRHFLEEFEKSVVANGLRELVDTFSLFLNDAYGAVILSHRATKIPLEEEPKPTRKFPRENVAGQLARLHGIFGTQFQLTPMFNSLVTARNCLTHHRGVVRQEDCAPGMDYFELTWRRVAMWAETADGRILAEFEPGTDKGLGVKITEETVMKAQFRDFGRHFPVGSVIQIERQDLAQICQATIAAADLVLEALTAHLRKIGVPNADGG